MRRPTTAKRRVYLPCRTPSRSAHVGEEVWAEDAKTDDGESQGVSSVPDFMSAHDGKEVPPGDDETNAGEPSFLQADSDSSAQVRYLPPGYIPLVVSTPSVKKYKSVDVRVHGLPSEENQIGRASCRERVTR